MHQTIKNKQNKYFKNKYKNKNEVNIIIYKKDYEKLKRIKSIYNITETEVYGMLKIKRNFKKNSHLFIITTLGFAMFLFLTNIIFKIEIIHSSKEIRNILKQELNKNGIKEYAIKKNYNEINKIKDKILNKYKNKIEWLEIENLGTKYIVKVEERKIPKINESNSPRNIVAKKSGVLKKVIAEKGDIVKDMDDYVNKGDLIITGDLIFNNELKGKVRAKGKVYAEIWYVTKTEYPLVIKQEIKTGKSQKIYTIKFLNKSIEFTFNKFKTKKTKRKTLFKHQFLPLSINKEYQEETKILEEVLTYEEALTKAKTETINEIKRKLNKDEYIIRSNYLKSTVNNSTIIVEMFFAVYEDITDFIETG
ncbi:MAG: sporulation protein YqfD [Bacilli bacterium]|nr:sporulation protein YqfD [Bacilli bacterium]